MAPDNTHSAQAKSTSMAVEATSPGVQEKKSGLVILNPGDVLFHEGDAASSLYIIQKGQLRLYRPKGKGFIELAVLRAGEVLGEMAYFAMEDSEKTRSCSAQAMIRTEIIEISFRAFDKTMGGLNPWFKTIVNTLASRLRKTNAKVKELETNSVSAGYGNSGVGYKFFRSSEIVKLLSTFFLVAKSHGEQSGNGAVQIHRKTLSLYLVDIYNLQEAKTEEFINLLQSLQLVEIAPDKDNFPNTFIFNSLESLRSLLIFFNTQRITPDEKRVKVSEKGDLWLTKIYLQFTAKNITTNKANADLTSIIKDMEGERMTISVDDLEELRQQKFVGDVIVGDNQELYCEVHYDLLKKMYLPIKFMNAINKLNATKTHN